MKIKVLVVFILMFLVSAVLADSSQDLTAEGKKNLRSANMHLGGSRFDKAFPLYELVLEENPHHIEAMEKIAGILYDQEHDYKQADNYYQKILEEIDNIYTQYEEMKAVDEKAAAKFYKSEIAKAKLEEKIDHINKLRSSCWVNLFNSAKAFFDEEDYDKALEEYLSLYEIAPDSLLTMKMLAHTYLMLERETESMEYMIIIAEMDENDDIVRTNLGNIMYQNGQFEEAVKWYKEAAEIKPDIIDNYYNMALAYIQLKDNENVIIAFEKVLEVEPDNLEAIVNISNLAAQIGDYEKSLNYLIKAVELDPENEEYVSILSYKLAQEKRFEEVLKYAERWQKLNPDSEEAAQLINLAKQNLKK